MKDITRVLVYHIKSQPGDGTLYDYYMVTDHDEYTFMPAGSTFKFPQRLFYFDIQDIHEINVECHHMAEDLGCNPHTLMECIRSIKEHRSQDSWRVSITTRERSDDALR